MLSLKDSFKKNVIFSFGSKKGEELWEKYIEWIRKTEDERKTERNKCNISDDLCLLELIFCSFISSIYINLIEISFTDLNNKDGARTPPRDILLKFYRVYFDQGCRLIHDYTFTEIDIMVENRVIELIERGINKKTHFNHFVHTNAYKRDIDRILGEVEANKDSIKLTYKKAYEELTGKELAHFCKKNNLSLEITERRGTDIMKMVQPDSSTKETDEDDVQED